ncbi:MAG TPA: hypothetical protein VLS96_13725 [Nodosilinea sp.]|nr:hypothetical protein [Nodosilinea sp.]
MSSYRLSGGSTLGTWIKFTPQIQFIIPGGDGDPAIAIAIAIAVGAEAGAARGGDSRLGR